tara:strand:- start:625 stop:918 length:294 start_codon:yes stop_codon:yes gene_type:complete
MIACLFGQYTPGKVGYWNKVYGQWENTIETKEQRLIWFKNSLDNLSEKLLNKNVKNIAFPFKIGCGLAGGNWKNYLGLIKEWETNNKQYNVYIIHKK